MTYQDTTIKTYGDVAERLDAIELFNKFPELDENWFDKIVSGNPYQEVGDEYFNDETEAELKDIYQWYLVSPSDAEWIKGNTDEIIIYSDVIDEYVWAITHFGTPWDSVAIDWGKK